MTCGQCSRGEYHVFPPEGTPERVAVTISFWCPVRKHHDPFGDPCKEFEYGKPKEVRDDVDW